MAWWEAGDGGGRGCDGSSWCSRAQLPLSAALLACTGQRGPLGTGERRPDERPAPRAREVLLAAAAAQPRPGSVHAPVCRPTCAIPKPLHPHSCIEVTRSCHHLGEKQQGLEQGVAAGGRRGRRKARGRGEERDAKIRVRGAAGGWGRAKGRAGVGQSAGKCGETAGWGGGRGGSGARKARGGMNGVLVVPEVGWGGRRKKNGCKGARSCAAAGLAPRAERAQEGWGREGSSGERRSTSRAPRLVACAESLEFGGGVGGGAVECCGGGEGARAKILVTPSCACRPRCR